MSEHKKQMMINMSMYTVGIMATKIISFIMLPFNSHYLSLEQFGNYDYTLVVCSLLLPIVSMALPETVYRFYTTDEQEEKRFSIFYTLILAVAGILTILSACLLIFLKQEYVIFICVNVFFNVLLLFFQFVIRAKGKIQVYLLANIINSVIQLALNIVLILNTGLRVEAILLSTIVAAVVSCLYLRIHIGCKFALYPLESYWNITKKLIPYALPLVPNSLNWWIINSVNKVYIKRFCRADALGIFAMASRFPNFVSSFSTVIYMSSMDSVLKEYDGENRETAFSESFACLTQILIPLTAFCMISTKIFIYLFVDEKYREALGYIPVLYVSVLVSIFASFFSIIYHCEKITYRNLQTSIYGSISTILLGCVFVRFWNLYGAVISMLGSNLIITLIRMRDVRKYVTLSVGKRNLMCEGAIFIFSITAYYFTGFTGTVLAAVLTAVFFVCCNLDNVRTLIKKN